MTIKKVAEVEVIRNFQTLWNNLIYFIMIFSFKINKMLIVFFLINIF